MTIARKLLCACFLLGTLVVLRPELVRAEGACSCNAEGLCTDCGTREYNLAICSTNNQTQIDNVCHGPCDNIQMTLREAYCVGIDEIDCQCGMEENQ